MKRVVAWHCEHPDPTDYTHPTSKDGRSRVSHRIGSAPTGCPNEVPLVRAGRFARRQDRTTTAAEITSAPLTVAVADDVTDALAEAAS